MTPPPELRLATLAAKGARGAEAEGDVAPPIRPSTNYARDAAYRLPVSGRAYCRDDNPTHGPAEADLLRPSIGIEDPADLIADLEQALGGGS